MRWVISAYLYALCGLALVTIVSPLLIIDVPILLLLAPPAIGRWRLRRAPTELGGILSVWLVAGSVVVTAVPLIAAIWYAVDKSLGTEGAILILTFLVLVPFPVASIRCATTSRQGRD